MILLGSSYLDLSTELLGLDDLMASSILYCGSQWYELYSMHYSYVQGP